MLETSDSIDEDMNDSQPSTTSTNGLDIGLKAQGTKPFSAQCVILGNQSTIFKKMLSMHTKPNETEYCTYIHRVCLEPRLEGFAYCNRHILYDKNSPFKQCSFLHPSSQRRCPNSARKHDRHDSKVFCEEHINFKMINKRIENFKQQFLVADNPEIDKNSPMTTAQKSLFQYHRLKRKFELLEKYCPSENNSNVRRPKPDWEINPDDRTIIMHRSFEEKKMEAFCKALYGERNNSLDPMKMQVVQIISSDDFEQDTMAWLGNDSLRYAGHLSVGDIENSLQEKFIKIRHLQLTLAKARPEILNLQSELRALRNLEKAGSCTNFQISSIPSETSHCKNKTEPESSYMSSVKVPIIVYGGDNPGKDVEGEGLLETVDERKERLQASKSTNLCVYQKGPDKCHREVLPLSRYCQKHILYDISQCLFRPCGASLNDDKNESCLKPIVPYTSKRTCIEHVQLKYTNEDIVTLPILTI